MYIFLFLTCLFKISSTELIVETTSGPIRSVPALSGDAEAFLGIPYAEPPIGKLRFAKPIPKEHWEDTYNASSLPSPCAQYSLEGEYYFMPDITNMSEDCLYLNIWMPKVASSLSLKPVIVYIHPGAFSTGSSNFKPQDGSHLASRGEVVVVTMNYRLGVFGYFLGFTEEANGNMGMYDQIMAIKWVRDNAKSFGGDPGNIVLMGVSAGAQSVSAHMISPLSKNLFQKAIIQSGSIVHPLFIDDNARLFSNSEMVASSVGCTNNVTLKDDPRAVVECLKNKSKEDLIAAELILLKSSFFNFYPRVNDEFLPKNSIELLREGKFRKDIDVMIGFTEDEGSLFLTLGLPEYFGNYGRDHVNVRRRIAMTLFQTAAVVITRTPPTELIDFYINRVQNQTSVGYTKMLANVLGDYLMTCSTVFFANILSFKGNAVYFYKFGFRSASTPSAEWIGTTHLDEVQYVFGNPYHENFTAEEEELSGRMIRRWSAFAKTGNPNLEGETSWPQYSSRDPQYLRFGQEEESIAQKPSDRCEFWQKPFKSDFDSDSIQLIRDSGKKVINSTVPNRRMRFFFIAVF